MKATGIVRRIDELGRIVVPKEIRKTLRIREGDPLEIFTDKDGEVILKKYSPIGELSIFAQEFVDATANILGFPVCVTDRDQMIAISGLAKKDYIGKLLHKDLRDAINSRKSVMAKKGDKDYIKIIENEEYSYEAEIMQTIICEGDAIGAVVILNKDSKINFTESERKVAMIAANFLGKQMEG